MTVCRQEIRYKGNSAIPRSCPTCKFGPCQKGFEDHHMLKPVNEVSVDRLKTIIINTKFRVKYSVESVVEIEAENDHVDLFMASDFPKGDGTYEDFERQFFAWCIGEDGFEFDERDPAKVLHISVSS